MRVLSEGNFFENANEAYESLAYEVENYGTKFAGTSALFNVSFTLINPMSNLITNPKRKWSNEYADIEYGWYKTGNRKPEMVEERAKLWSKMKDDKGYVNSNYGSWWLRNGQLDFAIGLIKEDKSTRRSVVVHYDPDEATTNQYHKDTPCNIVLNFFVTYDDHKDCKQLNMTIFARSIDLVFGFCNDQYCFSKLLYDCAKETGLKVGVMHYFITNLHIYDHQLGKKY